MPAAGMFCHVCARTKLSQHATRTARIIPFILKNLSVACATLYDKHNECETRVHEVGTRVHYFVRSTTREGRTVLPLAWVCTGTRLRYTNFVYSINVPGSRKPSLLTP